MKNKIDRFLTSQAVQLIARFVLGGIFIYAGIVKVLNPLEFSKIVYSYKLLPGFLVSFVALYLPWLELVTGLMLCCGLFTRAAAIILSTLLVVFIAALVINGIRGVSGHCGCFTIAELTKAGHTPGASGGLLTLVRDILFLIPGVAIIYWGRKPGGGEH